MYGELDGSRLTSMDLEQALNDGTLKVSETNSPFNRGEGARNTALLGSDRSKFGASVNFSRETFDLEYVFEKPVLMAGYIIQTANDTPERDPVNWTIQDENGNVIHTVKDERPRGRFEDKKYSIDGPGALTKKIVLKVSETKNMNSCQLCQFQILVQKKFEKVSSEKLIPRAWKLMSISDV